MLMTRAANYMLPVWVLLAALGAGQAQEAGPAVGDPGWPRHFTAAGGEQVVVYQPQLLAWPGYRSVDFLVAVAIQPRGVAQPYVGTVRVTADTAADLDSRTVLLTNPKLKELSFPGVSQETQRGIEQQAKSLLKTGTRTISLDRLLAAAVKLDAPVKGVAVKYEPPPIFYSEKPALMVITDGDPVLCPIDKTSLMYVVNTNWDLFYEQATTSYYLRDGRTWLRASVLAGPWQPADKLPADLGKLPADDNWKDVRASLPPVPLAAAQLPQVFTSTRPAELLLINGRPQFTPISGVAGLLYVANTDSDLFLCGSDSRYYLLLSGRWFSCANPAQGGWVSAGTSLPAVFAQIPPDSPRARVLVSVPGTPQAREAAILAQIPQTATVKTAAAKVDVTYSGEPKFVPIEGTTMQYAVNSPYSVLRVGDLYYCCFQGVWFVSSAPGGPWVVTGNVPSVVYTIPPSAPVYEVTQVTVVDDNSAAGEVTFAFAAGMLLGALVADDGCVVYGTGWYYPPYVWLPPPGPYRYPVYYPWHYSYGSGVHYNPTYGVYEAHGRYYGPYGGAGWGAAYNPHTGTYARGAAAYGPYAAGAAGAAYNPYTGAYARGAALRGPEGSAAFVRAYDPSSGRSLVSYNRSNPYGSWGETVATRGNDWIHSGYRQTDQGQVHAYETSRDTAGVRWDTTRGSGFVVQGQNDTYAGHDGSVYKHTDNGWQHWDDGSWTPVQQPLKTGATAGSTAGTGGRTLQPDVADQLKNESQVRASGQDRATRFEASRSEWTQTQNAQAQWTQTQWTKPGWGGLPDRDFTKSTFTRPGWTRPGVGGRR